MARNKRNHSQNQSPVGELMEKVERRRAPIKPKSVSFKTKKQLAYYEAINCNTVTLSSGCAGTGKTFVAVYAACCALANDEVEKIIITKPAVEIGKTQGYLPGDMEEKMAPFIRSIEECFEAIIGETGLHNLYSRKQLEILPLNFIRGLTFEKVFLICDEAQNADYAQVKSLLTRIGPETKYVINGDIDQSDLHGRSGLPAAIEVLKNVDNTAHVVFTLDDIVRSGIVRDILIEYHIYEKNTKDEEGVRD